MRHICWVLVSIFMGAFSSTMSAQSKLSKVNLKDRYNVDSYMLCKSKAIQTQDSIWVLLEISYDPNNLFYKTFVNRIWWDMSYSLVPSYDQRQVLKYDTLRLKKKSEKEHPHRFWFEFRIPKIEAPTYSMVLQYNEDDDGEVRLTDIPLRLNQKYLIPFIGVFEKKGAYPVFNTYGSLSDSVFLKSGSSALSFAYLRHYTYKFSQASPPMATEPLTDVDLPLQPDTTFKLPLNTLLAMPMKGLYGIVSNPYSDEAACIYQARATSFPKYTRIDELISPLVYIVSDEERRSIRSAKNPKQKLDEFWMDLAGDKDFARKMIRNYYRKVAQASTFFTQYKEGWRTDQGMIYIIFGLPNEVSRQGSKEIWMYEKRNSLPSLSFVFQRKTGPFGTSIYELQTSEAYTSPWFTAIELWRKGVLEK